MTSEQKPAQGPEQSTIDFGVEYTGAKPGAADTGLDPVRIGLTTMIGGVPAFPELEATADATVKFLNEELSGIDGHPVELVKCFIQSEEDGQKCGAEFLNAGVPVINQALAVFGNASLYKTLAGKVPVLVGTPASSLDSSSKSVFSFTGGQPSVIYAMAQDTKNIGSENAAILFIGDPAGKFVASQIAVPALDQLGVDHSKVVYFTPEATTPDIVSALQAAGGSSAGSIFFNPSGPQQCVALFDAMRQLGIDKPVVATPICNADLFIDHTGGKPTNWRIWGFGENPRVASNDQVQVFTNVMDTYGQSQFKYVGFAPSTMRDLLTIAKLGNEIGADQISPETMQSAILRFRGPAFMTPGPQNCEEPPHPVTPSLCGNTGVGSAFEGEAWKSLGAIENELRAG